MIELNIIIVLATHQVHDSSVSDAETKPQIMLFICQ